MAGKGCRDCNRCTEIAATKLIMVLPRMALFILTCWNIGLFKKKCPQCGHGLNIHQKTSDGRFKD